VGSRGNVPLTIALRLRRWRTRRAANPQLLISYAG
jgi:hypothetical protein